MRKKILMEQTERLNRLAQAIYNESKHNAELDKYYRELFDIWNIMHTELDTWNADNGHARSYEKAQAARENGKKGGRPKKDKTENI